MFSLMLAHFARPAASARISPPTGTRHVIAFAAAFPEGEDGPKSNFQKFERALTLLSTHHTPHKYQIAAMAKIKKRGESGAAKNYITRNQALKKLQLSLSDFRRLCILKGIFPRQPRHAKRANKGNSAPASFYYSKDIAFLQHEPVLKTLREHKAFAKKLSRALGRGEFAAAKGLEENKPVYRLDHIIKER